jgi:hypothetical protein
MKSKIISTRLEPQDSKAFDELSQLEGLDRSVMMRHILHIGLGAYRQNAAVQAYAQGKMTLGRAAELAGISQWEMLGVLDAHRTDLNYDAKEMEKDNAHSESSAA